MPVAPSFSDLLVQFEGEALAVRPTIQFLDGDMTTAQEHGTAAMADASIRYAAQGLKSTFLDGAEGEELTALVDDHLNIQRAPATAAAVDVTFTRTSGGAGFTLPVGYLVGSAYDAAGNTVVYTLSAPVTFTLADNGPHAASADASVLGKVGNVAAGLVNRIVSTKPDATLVVTNASAAGGGNDAESDPDLRLRARTFWLTLRRGTLAALEFGARQVAAVRTVKASEDPSTGLVTIVVADSDGNSTAQMISDTEAEEENWRAAGSTVTVIGGTQIAIDLTGVMVFRAGSGADALVYQPLVEKAITSRLAKLRQGETVYLQAMSAAGIAVDPDVIEAIVFSLPSSDVIPSAEQTPRAGTITLT
jgi:hypothetical protein